LPTLAWTKRKKLNELIEPINEKDELLESYEDLLIKESKKFVKLKNAYAQEVEKCVNLTKELSFCHDSISSIRNENASLVSKVKELNVAMIPFPVLKMRMPY
jgi:chromosome segregation ATPase